MKSTSTVFCLAVVTIAISAELCTTRGELPLPELLCETTDRPYGSKVTTM